MWVLQLAGMAVALAIQARSFGRPRHGEEWACYIVLTTVWVLPVLWWVIGTVDGLRRRWKGPR